jgi:hypothetical protein
LLLRLHVPGDRHHDLIGVTPPSSNGVTTSPGGLAFTGVDIDEMALIGVAAIGVGAVRVLSRRRTA